MGKFKLHAIEFHKWCLSQIFSVWDGDAATVPLCR